MSNIMNEPGIEKEILRLNLIYEFNKFFAMGFDEAMKYKPSTSKYIQKIEKVANEISEKVYPSIEMNNQIIEGNNRDE